MLRSEMIIQALDQLWFQPLFARETIEDRAEAVDNLLRQNGCSWDDVLELNNEDHRIRN